MKKFMSFILMPVLLLNFATACKKKCETCQFEEWKTIAEATCSEKGKKERKCTVCGEKEMQDIAPVAHTYGEWMVTSNPTCDAEGVKKRMCEICSSEETVLLEKTAHQYGDWETKIIANCSTEGNKIRKCSICLEEETASIEKTAHKYSAWKTVVAATCGTDGSRSRTCTVCDYTETGSISAAGHSYGGWTITTAATCKSKGLRSKKCKHCGTVKTEQIAVSSHNVNDATGKCSTCGAQVSKPKKITTSNFFIKLEDPMIGSENDSVCLKITNNTSLEASLSGNVYVDDYKFVGGNITVPANGSVTAYYNRDSAIKIYKTSLCSVDVIWDYTPFCVDFDINGTIRVSGYFD